MAIRSPRVPATPKPTTTSSQLTMMSRQIIAFGCLSLLLAGSTGCSMTSGLTRKLSKSDCIDSFMIQHRNRTMAQKAWLCEKDRFCNRRHAKDFKQGFIAGYLEVAEGGNGCVPAIAPSSYWGWRYQSADGQNAVNAWFEGYPMGVRAAEQDGVGNWTEIRPSSMAQMQYEPFDPNMMPMNQNGNPFQQSGEHCETEFIDDTIIEIHEPQDHGATQHDDQHGNSALTPPMPEAASHQPARSYQTADSAPAPNGQWLPSSELLTSDSVETAPQQPTFTPAVETPAIAADQELVNRFEPTQSTNEPTITSLTDQDRPQVEISQEPANIFAPLPIKNETVSEQDDSELPFSFQ